MIDEEVLIDEMGRRKDNLQFALYMSTGNDDYMATLSLYKSLIEMGVLYEVYKKYAENPTTTEENQRGIMESQRICSKIEEDFLKKLSQSRNRREQ